MKQPLKFSKIAALITLLIMGINYCESQTKPQIKIEWSTAGYKSNNLNITNDSDIEVNFGISGNADNYTFSYQLNRDTTVNLVTPSKKDNNTISFLIRREDYNRPNINSITFTINTKTPAQTYTVILPISSASLSQGNILDDAIALEKANGTDIQLLIDILSFHSGRNLSYSELQDLIKENPYLNSLIQVKTDHPAKTYSIASADNTVKGVSRLSNGDVTGAHSFSSLSGLDVTKYANAMADIMIDHAKEELTIAFFSRFDKFIEKHEEFRVLFPKTTEKLSKLLSYKYPEMIKALREVFNEDLRLIAYRVDDVLLLPKYQVLSSQYPEIAIAIKSLRLIHQLETDGLDAAGVLNTMANFTEWESTNGSNGLKNFGNALKVANLLSQSISKKNKDGYYEWHESSKTIKLFQNDRLFTYYMGLVYLKANSPSTPIIFIPKNGKPPVAFTTLLSAQETNILSFQNRLQEFVDLIGILKKSVTDLNTKSGKLTDNDRNTYISNSIDVLQYSFSMYTFFDPSFDRSDKYITVLRLSNDIYKNIYEEKYNAAISNTLDLFENISKLTKQDVVFSKTEIDSYKSHIDGLDDSVANNADKRGLKATADKLTDSSKIDADKINYLYDKISDPKLLMVKSNSNLNSLLDLVQKIKPYALFMANMVEAKDEKEVKAALDAVILPVGSSSIKKNSDFNFNIQSYLGARLSFTDPKNEAVQSTWNDQFAISAPIGFSVSHGFDNNWGAISLFLPVLDLGAIVDYQLKYENEGTPDEELGSKDYTIKIGQIFSPGAYIVYGMGLNIPISLGFGGQYGPGLSRIDEDNSTTVSNPYWKWNMFLSVDIPLFNLSNKAKVK